MRESNSHQRFWRPLSYHLTNPLYRDWLSQVTQLVYFSVRFLSIVFFKVLESFGRQLIADPQFPNKIRAGHREDVRPCLICNEECIGRIFGRLTQLSCAVNPAAGLEGAMEITKLPVPKKVAVAGAGPGGLEAARTAALRGCQVTIYEASGKIGGTFADIASSSFKKRIRDLIQWYDVQLKKLGVKIVFNTKVTEDSPFLTEADEIFVATGSLPCIPRSVNIQETDKVIDVTQAHIHGVKGQKVVICGGGLSGCDTALELAMQGKEVTIVEQMENCARDVMAINKISLDTLLAQYQVKILTNTKVTEISDKGVTAETEDGSITLEADAIVTAFGQKANSKTADAIASRYPCKTTLIGDCQKPSKAGKAIREGFYAAMALQ